MRERIHKPKSFQPIPYTNLETSLLKKQEILPRPEAPQNRFSYSLDAAEKKELISLSRREMFSKLDSEDRERLTFLQAKQDRLLRERFDRATEEVRKFGQKEFVINSDRQEPIDRVQAKLTIGKPNDKYEQEADKIAEQVMNAPAPVQKQDLAEQDEEVRAKPKSYRITPLLQPQLENMAVDEDEELMQAKRQIQRQTEMPQEEDQELMQPKSLVQAQLDDLPLDEEEEMMQAKGNGNRSNADTEDLESKLNNTRGGGSPLPETTLDFMESRFGADFSGVRVHNDSTAASMNQSIQAQAFTQGKDIYFNTGKYSPDSNEGKSLLAHELTHVLQQRGDEIAPKKDLQIQKQEKSEESEEKKDEANPIIKILNYVWGTVIGDWNNEQDPLQILVNTGVGLVPIADQILDLRDFTAHLYYMVFQKNYKDPMRWLALALTAVGAIPFVGSIVKGLGKIALFSDAAKGIGKFAEPLLQQIRQINPEWADLGKLRAAIAENWDAGVAYSKSEWMKLVGTARDGIQKMPLLPDFIWGSDLLKQTKQDLLNTISKIEGESPAMLDDALAQVKQAVENLLEQLDRIAKEKLGQPELVPEAVGDKVGAYNRTSVEPPQRNEPMLSVGSSSSSVPPSMKGISSIEFKRLSEIAANRGLKSDLVTNLYDDLGEKAVKDLLTKSDDEIAAAMRSVELERIDAGHSLDRHGPQLDDKTLEERLTKGKTPGDTSGRVRNAPPGSTRFSDFKDWEQTRNAAWKEIEKINGVDLTKAPASGDPTKYQIVVEYNRPIDEGFVGQGSKTKVVDPVTGKKVKINTNTDPVEGITRTLTTIAWDNTNKKWQVVQHFPLTKGWDNATKTYSVPADASVTL